MAGVQRSDIDLAMVYDSFTITVLATQIFTNGVAVLFLVQLAIVEDEPPPRRIALGIQTVQ